MKKRPEEIRVQESINNAMSIPQAGALPAIEKESQVIRSWFGELVDWHEKLMDYQKGERREKLLKIIGRQSDEEGEDMLFSALSKTTIYDKIYDGRNRPGRESADRLAGVLETEEKRCALLEALGWHENRKEEGDRKPEERGRKGFMDWLRKDDSWFSGVSWENIRECLSFSKGTMENLRKPDTTIMLDTVYRIMVTLRPENRARNYRGFGLYPLESGEYDGVEKICARAYRALGVSRGSADVKKLIEAHKRFWATMWTLLLHFDLKKGRKWQLCFFPRTNIEYKRSALDLKEIEKQAAEHRAADDPKGE